MATGRDGTAKGSHVLNISLQSSKRPALMPDSSSFLSLGLGAASPADGQGSWMVALGVGVAALVLVALLSERPGNNDDDDSSPGGGLMQPVA